MEKKLLSEDEKFVKVYNILFIHLSYLFIIAILILIMGK